MPSAPLGTPGPAAPPDPWPLFVELLAGLRAGDEQAAREVHRRYTPRLVALAQRQFTPALLRRVDPESVVQSVYRSFFRREGAGQYTFGDWDDLWGLLACITLRKCSNRTRFHRQESRDVGREVRPGPGGDSSGTAWEPADREPTPFEATVLRETMTALFQGLTPRERRIVEGLLAGGTVEEVRRAVGCGERTVRRVRNRVRAKLARTRDED